MYWVTPLCLAAERVPALESQSGGQRCVEGGPWHPFPSIPDTLKLAAESERREIFRTAHSAKIPVTPWFKK